MEGKQQRYFLPLTLQHLPVLQHDWCSPPARCNDRLHEGVVTAFGSVGLVAVFSSAGVLFYHAPSPYHLCLPLPEVLSADSRFILSLEADVTKHQQNPRTVPLSSPATSLPPLPIPQESSVYGLTVLASPLERREPSDMFNCWPCGQRRMFRVQR